MKNKGKYEQPIRETEIDGTDWAAKHWRTIEVNYRTATDINEIAHRVHFRIDQKPKGRCGNSSKSAAFHLLGKMSLWSDADGFFS